MTAMPPLGSLRVLIQYPPPAVEAEAALGSSAAAADCELELELELDENLHSRRRGWAALKRRAIVLVIAVIRNAVGTA